MIFTQCKSKIKCFGGAKHFQSRKNSKKSLCQGDAYSRPKNIKDSMTKAKLHQAPGREASKYYSGELS